MKTIVEELRGIESAFGASGVADKRVGLFNGMAKHCWKEMIDYEWLARVFVYLM